jgi:hypothetical protein
MRDKIVSLTEAVHYDYCDLNEQIAFFRLLQDETTYEKFTYSTSLILVELRKNIHMGKMRLMSRPNTFIIFI